MLYKDLLTTLKFLQQEVIRLVNTVAETDYRCQFHPDLSPIGWHLGHCIYTESYWIKEQLLAEPIADAVLKSVYVAELSQKASRSACLPEKLALLEWAATRQAENHTLLKQAVIDNNPHPLLKDDYLLHFLIQHYAQHIETIYMVLIARQQQTQDRWFNPVAISQQRFEPTYMTIAAGDYVIGSAQQHHYDNERPVHTVPLQQTKIARLPVSNSEFLMFINANGYTTADYWCAEGWQWRCRHNITHPYHWQLNQHGQWYTINHQTHYSLAADAAVAGLSYYEASAYARFVGRRLPHEYEWEAAYKQQLLAQTGEVWEWCHNAFHPYHGFKAYPYDNYSVPYFDDKHYVLKGGSLYTKNCIKRGSFRNYYLPEKRHFLMGLRLAY